jgi:hypothetical protein
MNKEKYMNENIASEFVSFEVGVDDAKSDMSGGWLPTASLDYIVNELRVGVGATDAYIAGYLSVVFGG